MSESNENEFLKIGVKTLNPAEPIPFDVFIQIGSKKIHYLKSGDQLSAEKLEKFNAKAPDAFFINNADKQKYKDYVHGRINDPDIDSMGKAVILRESSMAMLEELFEHKDVKAALESAKEVIESFISVMDKDPKAMASLISLSSHDFYTYNHSLDVSIYSLGLGKALGFEGEELQELGEGALVHDIGKRNVDVDIITKPGPLDDEEWAQMKKHPEYGLLILNEHGASDNIKACAFEHHENMLGNGYPLGLQADEIHPMAKIIAITDTYDALTTKRSYNNPMSPKEALNFMKVKLAGRYDEEYLEAMYSVLFKMDSL